MRPPGAFPASYLEFLQWSNGGIFVKDGATYQILGTHEVREYLLIYHLPQYVPGAVPWAMDGSGGPYCFDMREKPTEGEYPIILQESGALSWNHDEFRILATSFVASIMQPKGPS